MGRTEKEILMVKQEIEEGKTMEEQRLKALLSATPDGVIVLLEDYSE